ncbi:DNA polymerase III subunit chi [Amylibacter marinus]|uniref:DNA polymerase III subunit chi n=1 Tax=Amylibacter marinus TaxID=1475483 RepID=A0ABQ5VS98_9RHOB|nr:DNA polymerase III subunit chi [Amylibacter marinus]GLQ34132.1 DNA polymerase III subunit chi [Amylibacter marinus]
MSEVFFYHLTRSPLQALVPDLAEKSLSRGWRVSLRAREQARLKWFSDHIWRFGDTSFLPHGLAGGDFDQDQPILLETTKNTKIQADILLLVDDAEFSPSEAADYQRVCLLFDGNDHTALSQARNQWRAVTAAGVPAQYWSQEDGPWQKKASST